MRERERKDTDLASFWFFHDYYYDFCVSLSLPMSSKLSFLSLSVSSRARVDPYAVSFSLH